MLASFITMQEVEVEINFEGWVRFYQVKVGIGKTLVKDGIREPRIVFTSWARA